MTKFVLPPWQLLVAIIAGLVNQKQQCIVEYLRTEIQVLNEKLGKKLIILNDDQHKHLAVRGKPLGRKTWSQMATTASPDSSPRRYWMLMASKWDSWKRVCRRPFVM